MFLCASVVIFRVMTPAPIKPVISIDVLNQIDIRVGTILAVADVPNSDKLVQLRVSFGDHERTIVAGMKTERSQSARDRGQAGAVCGESGAPQDAGRTCRKGCCSISAMPTECARYWQCQKVPCRTEPEPARISANVRVPTPWRISRKHRPRGKDATVGLHGRRESPDEKSSCKQT